jgi:hypothetical protein
LLGTVAVGSSAEGKVSVWAPRRMLWLLPGFSIRPTATFHLNSHTKLIGGENRLNKKMMYLGFVISFLIGIGFDMLYHIVYSV